MDNNIILNHLRKWCRYKRMMDELNNDKVTISIHHADVNEICKIMEHCYNLSVAMDAIKKQLYESPFEDGIVDAVIGIIESEIGE